MASKRDRNYKLEVELIDGSVLIVEPPFTIEFNVERSNLFGANRGQVRIYNLSADHRNQIRRDLYAGGSLTKVVLKVGYGELLSTILAANISQAWSVREGSNFITQIECFDGGYGMQNANVNLQVTGGTPIKTVITSLIDLLKPYGIARGTVGDYTGTTGRSTSYSGNAMTILHELTGGGFFVDNGIANALTNSEALDGPIPIISAQTGLIGTPVREQKNIRFDMILEPNLYLNQRIQVLSQTGDVQGQTIYNYNQPSVNQIWRIVTLSHRGLISEAVCGTATTSVCCNQFTGPVEGPIFKSIGGA